MPKNHHAELREDFFLGLPPLPTIGQASTQDVKLLKAGKEKQLKKTFLKKKTRKKRPNFKKSWWSKRSVNFMQCCSFYLQNVNKKGPTRHRPMALPVVFRYLSYSTIFAEHAIHSLRWWPHDHGPTNGRAMLKKEVSSQCSVRPSRQTSSSSGQQHLEDSRRGYTYSAKILARILGLLRKNGNVSHSGPTDLSPYQKALWAIFAGERSNSYQAIQNRRHTPSFKIEEVNNILFLCGRKMAEDTISGQPSIHKEDAHYLLKEAQESSYMVPILSTPSALGVAVAQEIHDQTCGSSPATAMARATRYFHFCPPAGNLFRTLQEDCFKCRSIRMVRG